MERAKARGAAIRGGRMGRLSALSHRGLATFALLGFSVISLIATAMGFADLRAAATDDGQLAPLEWIAVFATTAFVVSAMIVALHYTTARPTALWFRPIALAFYVFFLVWTVGFGFGFFWKELAGQDYTARSFREAVAAVSASAERASAAVAAVAAATDGASETARQRAEAEAKSGGTCANRPNSGTGQGPLVRSRFAFAGRAEAVAEDVRSNWVGPLLVEGRKLSTRTEALAGRPARAADAAEQALLERLAKASA